VIFFSFTDLGVKESIFNAVDAAGIRSERFTELADVMAKQLIGARSGGTVDKYYAAYKRWKTFIQAEGGRALPAEPIHVALYISSLINQGSSVSVVQSALYSIKWAHNMHGANDPTDNAFVKNLLEKAKRGSSRPVVKKDPVTSDQIVNLCDKYAGSKDILVLRDLAFIVLCFSGFFRFNDVQSLRSSDILFEEFFISVHIRSSKTDQYRKGNTVLIGQGETSACPIKLLKSYMECGGISVGSNEYLFRPVYSNKGKKGLCKKNKPISYTRARETVVARLREVCGQANLGLHSLRAGGATTAARASVPDRLWKRHGRWRSENAKDGYVDDSIDHKLIVSKSLCL
jgi:integrase